jgi:Cys-tRNA(Pro)/Cys-tRNA(Cys) deacylase
MKPPRVALEATAMAHDLVTMNGGQRGLQVRLSPRDAATVLKAIVAPLVA